MLIVGSGAVACLMLRAFPQAQVFAPPSPRSEALRAQGYDVAQTVGEVRSHQHWIVCTKATQNRTKVAVLEAAPRPESILVVQNGLHPQRDWERLAPSQPALSTYGVRCPEPGRLEGGRQGEIWLQEGSPFAQLMRESGLSVVERQDMVGAVWAKLMVNASLNVVMAILDLPNGELLHSSWGLPRAVGAAFDVARLARSQGVELPYDPAALLQRVAEQTRDNICSTLVDLRRGGPTEYDHINGELLRLARRGGISVPYLEELDAVFHREFARPSFSRAS